MNWRHWRQLATNVAKFLNDLCVVAKSPVSPVRKGHPCENFVLMGPMGSAGLEHSRALRRIALATLATLATVLKSFNCHWRQICRIGDIHSPTGDNGVVS